MLLNLALVSFVFLACSVDAKKKSKKGGAKGDEAVLTLTDENFDAMIAEHDPLLVAFTAPWCGHCKALKPEFASAAADLKKDDLFIANVDATVSESLASRFDIKGFPTIKFFRKGVPSDYEGERSAAAIARFVRSKSGPAYKTLTTEEDILTYLTPREGEDSSASVAFVDSVDSPLAQVIKDASSAVGAIEDSPYAIAVGASAAARAKVGAPATGDVLVSLNNFEGEDNAIIATTEDVASGETVNKFLVSHSMPLVVTFSPATQAKIFRGPLKTHMLVFVDEDKAEDVTSKDAKAVSAIRKASQDSTSRQSTLFVQVPKADNGRIMEYFGIVEANLPQAIFVNMGDAGLKKFKIPEGQSLDDPTSYTSLIASFVAGTAKPFLKSAPAPDAAVNAAAAVKIVTGANYEAIVLDNDKDVLLEIYAPWCGHCKSLAPIYEALGESVKANGLSDKLVIAKMDGTENEVEGIEIKGFPTLFFFPAAAKSPPVDYAGARDAAGFVEFLQQRGTYKTDYSVLGGDEDDEEEEDEHAGHDHGDHDGHNHGEEL